MRKSVVTQAYLETIYPFYTTWRDMIFSFVCVVCIMELAMNISRVAVGSAIQLQGDIPDCDIPDFSLYIMVTGACLIITTTMNAALRILFITEKLEICGKHQAYPYAPYKTYVPYAMSTYWYILTTAVHLALCIWGYLKIYVHYNNWSDFYDESTNSVFCQPSTYWFAFWCLTYDWISLAAFLIIILVYLVKFVQQRMKKNYEGPG